MSQPRPLFDLFSFKYSFNNFAVNRIVGVEGTETQEVFLIGPNPVSF